MTIPVGRGSSGVPPRVSRTMAVGTLQGISVEYLYDRRRGNGSSGEPPAPVMVKDGRDVAGGIRRISP